MRRRYMSMLLLIVFFTAQCWSWVRIVPCATRRTSPRATTKIYDQQLPNAAHPHMRRNPQARQKPRSRKPKGYWLDISNIEKELRDQWKRASVTVDERQPPPIPNETLLNYWKRNDLRSAIVQSGGRDSLSERLGGAFLVPGKWCEATQNVWVEQLIASDPNLDSELPPPSPQQLKRKGKSVPASSAGDSKRWGHQSTRRDKGHWSSELVVIQELYEFLNDRRIDQHLPAVWMPRNSELKEVGRDDLRQAIQRFGGTNLVCRKAGLIRFREWRYIEGQYDLLLELRSYLDEYHNGDYSTFPNVSQLSEQGYERLNRLIQYYGGRKFVANRFGMLHSNSNEREMIHMSWGKFDLDFAINLLEFIRTDSMKKNPPLRYPAIGIPSPKKLLASGDKGILLDQQIKLYGGYENVARRLGLAYFFPKK